MLAWTLSKQLAVDGLTFRQEFDAYSSAFSEVTRQVGVHCAERGQLLGRLQHFYMRSVDATARAAERSVRAAYEEQLASLTAELKETRQQLGEAKVGRRATAANPCADPTDRPRSSRATRTQAAAGQGASPDQVSPARTGPSPDATRAYSHTPTCRSVAGVTIVP